MKNGPSRFTFYLDQLEILFLNAAKQDNAALWLYQNNARTPLFMLEGLARLYSHLHNEKRFTKIERQVKLLEDALGAIDYYDGFGKQFAADKKIPAAVKKFVAAKVVEKTAVLTDILHKHDWINNAKRIAKIRKRLKRSDWLNEKAEVKAIDGLYKKWIAEIDAFAEKYASGFTELETEVHELRRKLRWLSIYPQAMQGCIQLTTNASRDKAVAKYLTPDITGSPFNKMPAAGDNGWLLMLSRDYFYALSWMIAQLGTLKDQGLRIVLLDEAGSAKKSDAAVESAILKQASGICAAYFAEKSLDKLISGVVKA